jgi:hypothetical protein
MDQESSEKIIQAISDSLWGVQGNAAALELICLQIIEDLARLHPSDPKGYMRQFVERARKRPYAAIAASNSPEAKRAESEFRKELEDFLELVLMRAGDLKT